MNIPPQPSILEYARFHGIANDHRALKLEEVLPQQHEDTEGLRLEVEEAHLTVSNWLEERPLASTAGANFLLPVIKPASSPRNAAAWEDILPDIPRETELKLIVPRLAIDNEVDLLSIRDEASLNNLPLNLPLEGVIDDNDEGVRFPRYIQNLSTEILEMITQEKIYCKAGAAETVRDMSRTGDMLEYVSIPLKVCQYFNYLTVRVYLE